MTETTNKRKNADDLPGPKKALKRMTINSSQGTTNSSCKGQPNEERICQIFENEIDTEIATKIKDLEIIQERLKQCHKDLNLLRKAVLTMYYEPTYKKSTKFDQHRIHPAVQKLIGKRPVNSQPAHEEMFEHSTRPLTRHMKKEDNTYLETPTNEKNEQSSNRIRNINIEEKIPQYIPPNLSARGETRLPRGNRQKKLIRILVGNVSKRVTDGSHDKATHKWMLYIRSEGLLEIGKDISKVRFFLHPSYKPHDVVTVPKAPFTLTRRGWGEFPVRVQLHFHNPLNKTVDILHHLKLDGVSSGPHSRSAETLADIWVYCNDRVDRPASNCETSENSDSSSMQQGYSSPSNSSEVSDSNMSSYNCDKSRAKKNYNVYLSADESELLNGGEYPNPSENGQSINVTSLISKCDFEPHDSRTKAIASTVTEIPSNGCSGKLDHLITRTTFNNKVFNVAAESCQQNSYLRNKKEFFASENNVDDNSNCLFKDLKLEDFNEDLNIDNMITNNIDLSGAENDFLNVLIECPLSLNGKDTVISEEVTRFNSIKSDLSHILGNTINTNGISNLSTSQNVSTDLDFGHEVEINLKPKTPDKNIEVTDKELYSNTHSINGFFENNVISGEFSKSEMINDCRTVGFDDKINIKNEATLFDSTEEFSTERVDKGSLISKLDLLLKSESDCEMKINSDNTFSNFDHRYAENFKFKSKDEIKIETESPVFDGTVIKEEMIEIEDCYSNWLEEVVIDGDCDMVGSYSTVEDADVISENLLIKLEPLPPKQDVCQDLSLPAENQLDGLTSSIEDFLKSTIECHLGTLKESFSENVTENFDLLENIDKKLSSLSETLPNDKTYLGCETNVELDVKNMFENKLDDAILELPSLDSFENYISVPVKNCEVDIDPEIIIPHCNATDNLTASQLNVELPAKDMMINKEIKLSSTNTCDIPKSSVKVDTNTTFASKNLLSDERKNVSVSAIGTSVTKSPQNILIPRRSKPTIMSNKTVNKTEHSGSSASGASKLVQMNPAGLLGTNSFGSLTSFVHKGTKQMTVVFKNKDGVISSSPNGQKAVVLQKDNQVLFTSQKGSINILNTDQSNSPNRVGLIKKNGNPLKCIYIPPANSNKTSVLRTVPGVSLLKKNLVVTTAVPAASNSLSMPLIVTSAPFQQSYHRVKIYPSPKSQVPLSNGKLEKLPSQPFKGVVKPIKEELVLSHRTPHVPVAGSLQAAKEKKIIVLNRTESKKMNFDGRITQLQSSLDRLVLDCNFADMELSVRWLVRGLPLITPNATQWIYKVIHPYSSASLATFKSWPSPKQFASEWLRAKTVCRMLERKCKTSVWTTKQVLYWARHHGYSPTLSLPSGVENKGSNIQMNCNIEHKNTFTRPENVLKWIETQSEQKREVDECEVIDVVGQAKTEKVKAIKEEEFEDENGTMLCGREWEKDLGSYVRETVNKLGYRLGREELVPGELDEGVALTILTRTMMIFAEDLLRRSLAASCIRKTSSRVELCDTYSALIGRQEFSVFTNAGLGSSQVNNG